MLSSGQAVKTGGPTLLCAISNTVASGDFSQVARAWFNRPLLRFAVYSYQPEFRAVTFEPLEIVQKRPVNIAPDIDSVREAFPYAGASLVDVIDAAVPRTPARTSFPHLRCD